MNIPLPQGSLPPDPDPQPVPLRLSGSAVASFVLGLLALPLNIFAGLPALLLGYRSLYTINASEGGLRGRPLAISGMALGVVGCLLAVGWALFFSFSYLGAASARVDCTNNLRQLGAALEGYQENHRGAYPAGTIPNPQLAPEQRLSWMTALLPYLERKTLSNEKWNTLVESIHPDQGWEAPIHEAARRTRVPLFLCQGALEPALRTTPGLTAYIGLAGVGSDAPSLPLSDPRAGFFGDDRTLKRSLVKEGLAYTMVVTETTLDNGPWIAGGPATVRGIAPTQTPLIGMGRPLGGCHFSFLTGIPGLNTLWLDGSVRYFTNSMPAQTFADQTRLER